ncbi:hypothetical protein [Ralstonia solanacearum]|uniref:hypothetical protein n=1 Tax=Ralstonia solanacearum TaxID=305 RepID=UPI003CC5652E
MRTLKKNKFQSSWIFTCCIIMWSISGSSPVHAYSAYLQTPEAQMKLAHAGSYLAAVQSLQAFKRSECGYTMDKTIPTVNGILKNEVLPAFETSARNEVLVAFQDASNKFSRESQSHVRDLIEAAKREHNKTNACEIVAAVLVNSFQAAYGGWQSVKSQHDTRAIEIKEQYPNSAQARPSKCKAPGANPVYGKCMNGKFVGYFSQTGKPVYGDCAPGGQLRGYDPETGLPVYGQCN